MAINEQQIRTERFYEDMAVILLEKVLRRQRWCAVDRDRIADFLKKTVRKAEMLRPATDEADE